MGLVVARQREQKDGTYRITCGAVRRKGELCPHHLGTAIRAADRLNTPVDVPYDKAFLGGNYYAGDGLAYRLDADTQFYLVESVNLGVPKPGKIEHRRGQTKHRPRRPMAASVANTTLNGLDAYEPYHFVVVPKIIGAFPILPAYVVCPGCGAINEVNPLIHFFSYEEEDEMEQMEQRSEL